MTVARYNSKVESQLPSLVGMTRSELQEMLGARPDAKLLVLRPNVADTDEARSAARMKEAGADCVVTNIAEALRGIEVLCPSCPPLEGAEPELARASAQEANRTDEERRTSDPSLVTAR